MPKVSNVRKTSYAKRVEGNPPANRYDLHHLLGMSSAPVVEEMVQMMSWAEYVTQKMN